MGEVKDLERQEGLKQLKKLAEEIKMCMLCTHLNNIPFETRPMATQEVDEEGNFWFLSSLESNKTSEIMENNRVQLIYSDPAKAHFMTVYGHAKIIKDREKTDELWDAFAKGWFHKEKDDPSVSLIRFEPESAYYWDTKHGKMVAMVKAAVAAVTGKNVDGGVEGAINV